MPFQQINLDQSIYNKPKWGSNVQQGRQQKKTVFAGASNESPIAAAGHDFVSKQKEEWAAEDKATKAQRAAQMAQLQNIGAQTVNKAQQATLAQAKQQQEVKQQVESNPEPFAEEQWKFFLSLDEEGQKRFIDQTFAPLPQKSTINGQPVPNAKTKYAGGVIADYWINKGYVMFDPKGNVVVNKPKDVYEKGTFEIVEKGGKVYKFNTATGEEFELGSTDEPELVVDKINKEANEKALALSKEGKVSFEDAKYDTLIDNGVAPEVAADLAKIKEIPKNPDESNWFKDTYKKIVDWIKSKKPKEAIKEDWEKAAGKTTKPTFKEENVTALVSVISNNVTAAERAYLKGQGASDADIDESIKRKGSK